VARRLTLLAAGAVAALIAAAPAGAQLPLPPSPFEPPPPQQPPPQDPQPAPTQPPPRHSPRHPVRATLSDERTHTRWANADTRARARAKPRRSARSVARLRYETEDGWPEVYLVLERYTDAKGRRWLKVRLPMRPNGRTGWVPRSSLGRLHTVHTFLRVDKHRLRATLFKRGKPVWRAPVGIGKHGTETPGGRFYIRERLKTRDPGSLYGPLAFGTSAYSKLTDWPGGGVVGIHGTNEPGLIPGRPSHGCVRVRNRDISKLGRIMPVGTPVRIK
jgi:hypothetical protein